jgi:gas vesicle protein
MSNEPATRNPNPANGAPEPGHGGFVALAVIAAAVGAGAALLLAPEKGAQTRKRVGRGLRSIGGEAAGTISQLQHDLRRRKRQSSREKQIVGLAGLFIGAGLAALLTPESGPDTRQRLGSSLSRIKVGTVDRIERLRQGRDQDGEAKADAQPVRSVQELGRDPNSVF